MKGLVPTLNAYVLDQNAQKWFVGNVRTVAWGSAYQLDCELESGAEMPELILPPKAGLYSDLIWAIPPNGDRTKYPIAWTSDNG